MAKRTPTAEKKAVRGDRDSLARVDSDNRTPFMT
jgi:hypothetical protein